MRLARWIGGMGLGALCVTGLFVAPALQAQERAVRPALHGQPSSSRSGGLGIFTPAAADPKLAAVLSRSGLPNTGFSFTPSESRRGTSRAVTVAVRAHSTRALASNDRIATPATISLAPIAYNLGVSVGWKRFSVSGDVTHVQLLNQPGSRERADIGLSYSGKRASGRVTAISDQPLANTPVLIGDKPSYSVDVGGSYSLTRNLDVTAGVRYKSERDRLPQLTETRRDSQAVYVGTAFRF